MMNDSLTHLADAKKKGGREGGSGREWGSWGGGSSQRYLGGSKQTKKNPKEECCMGANPRIGLSLPLLLHCGADEIEKNGLHLGI